MKICRSFLTVAFSLGVIAIPTEMSAKVSAKELFYVLKRDGIYNSLEPETRISSLGRILLRDRWYSLFYYDHVTPATKHGLRRILILNDRKRYIGGYNVEESDNCRLIPPRLICDNLWGKNKVTLDFSSGKIPRFVSIDGMDVTFAK